MRHTFVFCQLLCLLLLTACEPTPEIDPGLPPLFTIKGGLYILNEGNFQSGNATVDYIDFESQQFSENAYEKVNQSKLGDVVQSMCVNGSLGYLVVNNSQKIEVIDLNNLKNLSTISGFVSPRYMAIKNGVAYVSEFYNGGIKLVNLNTNAIFKQININGNLNEMLGYNNELFVTNTNGKYLYVVDFILGQVVDSVLIAYGANSIQQDANGNIWVLCSGNNQPNKQEPGGLFCLNPTTKEIIISYTLTSQSDHGSIKLRMNKEKTTLYWLNKNLYQHNINQASLNQQPFIYAGKKNYWALRVDTLSNEIYVADAIDYVQKSNVERYDVNGSMKGIFKAGVITTDFNFYYK